MTTYVEISGVYKTHTDGAVLIDEGSKEVWIPRSVIEMGHDDGLFDGSERDKSIELSVAEWFAKREGLT